MAEDRDIIEQQDAVPVSEPVVETDNEVDAVCDEPSAVSGKYNRLFADSGNMRKLTGTVPHTRERYTNSKSINTCSHSQGKDYLETVRIEFLFLFVLE